MIVSMIDQVLIVWPTPMPKYGGGARIREIGVDRDGGVGSSSPNPRQARENWGSIGSSRRREVSISGTRPTFADRLLPDMII